jgi:hypothetical protein
LGGARIFRLGTVPLGVCLAAGALLAQESGIRKPLGLSLTAEELAREEDQLHFGLFERDGNLVACVVAVKSSWRSSFF